jgi:hypothetical protein
MWSWMTPPYFFNASFNIILALNLGLPSGFLRSSFWTRNYSISLTCPRVLRVPHILLNFSAIIILMMLPLFSMVLLVPNSWSNYPVRYRTAEQPVFVQRTQKCFLNSIASILFWSCYVIILCERFWYYTLPCTKHMLYVCFLPKNCTS